VLVRVANSLFGARRVAAVLCSLALTGCPQFLQDDFKVVSNSADDGGHIAVNGGTGGASNNAGGVGGTTDVNATGVGGTTDVNTTEVGGATDVNATEVGGATDVMGGTNGTGGAGGTGGDTGGTGGTGGDTGGTGGTGGDTGGTNSTGGTGIVGTAGTAGLCTPGAFVLDPGPISGLNVTGDMWAPTLSADDLSLYFSVWDGSSDRIYVATRTGRGAAFSAAVKVTIQGFSNIQAEPFISASGLNLYFASYASGSSSDRNIWIASRTNTSVATFSNAQQLGGVNTTSYEGRPWLTDNELVMYYVSGRPYGRGDYDVWKLTRASTADSFSTPTNLPAPVNTTSRDGSPVLSRDGLTLYFSSDRTGGWGQQDIWTATRPDLLSDFGAATNLSQINSESDEVNASLSHDEAELFFVTDWSATIHSSPPRIWRATRSCTNATQ
jgi:hypothetical protein